MSEVVPVPLGYLPVLSIDFNVSFGSCIFHPWMIPRDVTVLASWAPIVAIRMNEPALSMQLRGIVTVRAIQSSPEMKIGSQSMLFSAIDPGRLPPRDNRIGKPPAEILLVQTHIIPAHMIGVMALQARCDPCSANNPVENRLGVRAIISQ
jgi:hypothetical protein